MRAIAPVIYRTFEEAKVEFADKPASEVEAMAMEKLTKAGLRPEYFTIFDGITLQPVANAADASFVIAATAAWAGDVRLIDNMVLKEVIGA